MCKNATETAANLILAIEPTVKELLTLEGLSDTPKGIEALAAYNTAETAVANWVPGTASTDVVQVIDAFSAIFAELPISPAAQTLESLIAGGIVAVIAVIEANSPATTVAPAGTVAAPTAPVSVIPAVAANAATYHTAKVVHVATLKIATLVPNFHPSIMQEVFHQQTAAATEYTKMWKKTMEASPYAKEAA